MHWRIWESIPLAIALKHLRERLKSQRGERAMVMGTAMACTSGGLLALTDVTVVRASQLTSRGKFTGRKLVVKWPGAGGQGLGVGARTGRRASVGCRASFELVEHLHGLVLGVGVGLPCTVMECGDVVYRSTLPRQGFQITMPGVALTVLIVTYLWATPG
jgi:hypothetical protein